MLRHVIFGGFSGSDGVCTGGCSEGRVQEDASHEHRIDDGRVKVGKGKRGGLKGSLAEILGKSSVKSHQNIPLPKPPLTRTTLAWYPWYLSTKILIAVSFFISPKESDFCNTSNLLTI